VKQIKVYLIQSSNSVLKCQQLLLLCVCCKSILKLLFQNKWSLCHDLKKIIKKPNIQFKDNFFYSVIVIFLSFTLLAFFKDSVFIICMCCVQQRPSCKCATFLSLWKLFHIRYSRCGQPVFVTCLSATYYTPFISLGVKCPHIFWFIILNANSIAELQIVNKNPDIYIR
jgi:hypothetical protein